MNIIEPEKNVSHYEQFFIKMRNIFKMHFFEKIKILGVHVPFSHDLMNKFEWLVFSIVDNLKNGCKNYFFPLSKLKSSYWCNIV